jgi:hypothetical protein
MRNYSILTGWWDFAVRALTGLTTPRADVEACDRALEGLARDSRIGGLLHRVSIAVRAAWSGSQIRSMSAAYLSAALPPAPAARWRTGGWVASVAGATALGLNQLATIPAGPLTWIVPAVLMASGAFVMAAAAPLSRAAADRRHRQHTS